MTRWAAIAFLAILCGCQTVSAPVDARQVWCDHNAPQQFSNPVIDAMSRAELDQMNEHNDQGIKWCRWVIT